MGNTCCTGRLLKTPLATTPSEKLSNIKTKPPQVKTKKNNKGKGKIQLLANGSKRPSWQDELANGKIPSGKGQMDENSLVYSSDSSEKSIADDRVSPANLVSVQSDMPSVLDYNLIMAEDLSKLQQNQILSALDSFSSLLLDDETESVDGLAGVIDKNKKMMLMLTTQAIYFLNADDLSLVERRVRIEHCVFLVISQKKDSFLIVVSGNSSENLLIRSDSVVDLLKAIQQLSLETRDKYLPWVTHENSSTFPKLILDKTLIQDLDNSDEHYGMIIAVVEHGNIGEVKIAIERCSDTFDGKEKNIIFVMTNEAIYTLDKKCMFKNRFLISLVEKISISQKEKYLVLYEEGGVHVFAIDISYAEKIQTASRKVGNMFKIVDD